MKVLKVISWIALGLVIGIFSKELLKILMTKYNKVKNDVYADGDLGIGV